MIKTPPQNALFGMLEIKEAIHGHCPGRDGFPFEIFPTCFEARPHPRSDGSSEAILPRRSTNEASISLDKSSAMLDFDSGSTSGQQTPIEL